jgi:predicted nucleic-acid-binding protein
MIAVDTNVIVRFLVRDDEKQVERLLADGAECSVDLSDILIAQSARALGCEGGITFDRGAAKLSLFNLLK